MAQVKLLKLDASGYPLEHSGAADDVTFLSYTVTGGGPVLSGTGLDLNNQDVVDVNDLAFNNPATGTINQTAGALIVDNIMAKERSNPLTTAADILFPVVTDVAGEVDAFRLPALAGSPTATPTASGEGFVVWDSTNNKLFIWNGSAWDDQSTVTSAENIDNIYTAEVGISARDFVYISSADNVSPAISTSATQAQAGIGFATAAAIAAASVTVRSEGILTGFSGLTAGSTYYLSAATAGLITATVPTGTGNVVLKTGIAKSATALHIQIQYLGRRA